jgi:hypothetical protein
MIELATNWQGEAEVVMTIIGTHDDMLVPNSLVRRQLAAFTRSRSLPQPDLPESGGAPDWPPDQANSPQRRLRREKVGGL